MVPGGPNHREPAIRASIDHRLAGVDDRCRGRHGSPPGAGREIGVAIEPAVFARHGAGEITYIAGVVDATELALVGLADRQLNAAFGQARAAQCIANRSQAFGPLGVRARRTMLGKDLVEYID